VWAWKRLAQTIANTKAVATAVAAQSWALRLRRLHPVPMVQRFAPSRPTPRRLLASWLVCALLLTQCLGLSHRIAHARGPVDAAQPAHASPVPEHGTLARLFAQHHDAADCQAFDQLSHADGVGFAQVHTPGVPVTGPCGVAPRRPVIAAQAVGFLARGPPARV